MVSKNIETISKHNSSPQVKKSFTVRQMEIHDLAEVYELGEVSFRADLWPMLYRGWDEYEVTSVYNTDGEYCLVAENDDYDPETSPKDERIVGFVIGTVMTKSRTAWNYGYIVWICAHPNWQKEGVARELLDKEIKNFIQNDGVRIVMADTDPRNTKAVGFFKNKGFDQEHKHVFLTTNLESNPDYFNVLREKKTNAVVESYVKKKQKSKKLKGSVKSKLKVPRKKKSLKKKINIKKNIKKKKTKKKK